MNEQDQHIIRLLQEDGRARLGKIAIEVGLNTKTVRNRVRELRESNVINITTVTDPELLGYHALGLIAVIIDRNAPLDQIASDIAGIEAVDHLVTCTGRFDVVAEVVCRDLDDIRKQIVTIQSIAGVSRTETFPILSLFYQEPHWEARRGGESGGVAKSRDLELNDVDRAILTALNEDGRVPLRDVARQLGVSEGQVRQRLGRMKATGGVRVLALTNPRVLGIQMAWAAIAVRSEVPRVNVAKRLAELDVVTYVVITAGRFDLWAEVSFANQEELLRILDEQFTSIDGIRSLEVCMYLDVHYRGLRPAEPRIRRKE